MAIVVVIIIIIISIISGMGGTFLFFFNLKQGRQLMICGSAMDLSFCCTFAVDEDWNRTGGALKSIGLISYPTHWSLDETVKLCRSYCETDSPDLGYLNVDTIYTHSLTAFYLGGRDKFIYWQCVDVGSPPFPKTNTYLFYTGIIMASEGLARA